MVQSGDLMRRKISGDETANEIEPIDRENIVAQRRSLN
jgi:hypothetical protein